jgi:hypothetical protein
MCPCEEEGQTTDYLIFKCNNLSKQKGNDKKIKKVALGLRHVKYLLMVMYNIFVKFITSIDFADIQ